VSRRQTDNTRVHQYPWVEDGQTIQEFINIELLYCLSVFYSQILMNSCIVCLSSTHRYWWTLVLDNTRVHQYPWVEDRQTIQEFINICEWQTDRQYKSSSISVSRRQTDNTRVPQILMNSCIVCPSSTHRYWWTLVLSVCLLLTDIDELLYCLSVFYSQILMNCSSISVSRRRTDNTRVHQYLWVEDRQTIQEVINICE
jgi:hypothetical protein